MINTEVNYSVIKKGQILTIEVNELMYEFNNKVILQDIESQMNNNFEEVILNLEKVKYINSMGLRFLISLSKLTTKNKANLILENVSQDIRKLIAVTKLEMLFPIR